MELYEPKYVEVYRARNLPEAHSIRIALEESGIQVRIEGELLQGAVGDLPPGWTTAPRILVEESRVAAAQKIIEQGKKQPDTEGDDDNDEEMRCLSCGKKMGAHEVVCRSCGWSYQSGEGSSQQDDVNGDSTKNVSDAAPRASNESLSKSPAPRLSQGDLRGEVLAVLAISVFPLLISVFTSAWHAPLHLPFWVDSVARGLRSACTAFAVLYLVHRSGEPWATFGIKRPRLADIPLGVMIYLVSWLIFMFYNTFLVTRQFKPSDSSLPKSATDYVLMVFWFSASGFLEELVTKSYLITRFEQLLRSGTKAVILSAALFGLYHLYQGPDRLLELMILGMVLGFLYLFMRRIWPFAIGHMLWNVIVSLRSVP